MNKKIFFIAAFLIAGCGYFAQAQEAKIVAPQTQSQNDDVATLNTQKAFLGAIKAYGQSNDDQTGMTMIDQFKKSIEKDIAASKADILKAKEKSNDAAAATAFSLTKQKTALYNALIKEIQGNNNKTSIITILKRYATLM